MMSKLIAWVMALLVGVGSVSTNQQNTIVTVDGAIHGSFTDSIDGTKYYQFRSHDDSVWWLVSAEEVGFIPQQDTVYSLTYNNMGTLDCAECPIKYECECELYDDELIALVQKK